MSLQCGSSDWMLTFPLEIISPLFGRMWSFSLILFLLNSLNSVNDPVLMILSPGGSIFVIVKRFAPQISSGNDQETFVLHVEPCKKGKRGKHWSLRKASEIHSKRCASYAACVQNQSQYLKKNGSVTVTWSTQLIDLLWSWPTQYYVILNMTWPAVHICTSLQAEQGKAHHTYPGMITKPKAAIIRVYYQSSLHNRIRQMPSCLPRPLPTQLPCVSRQRRPMAVHWRHMVKAQLIGRGLTLQTQWLRIRISCFFPISLSVSFFHLHLRSRTATTAGDEWEVYLNPHHTFVIRLDLQKPQSWKGYHTI